MPAIRDGLGRVAQKKTTRATYITVAFVNARVLALVFMQFDPDHLRQPPFWNQAYVDVFRMLQ